MKSALRVLFSAACMASLAVASCIASGSDELDRDYRNAVELYNRKDTVGAQKILERLYQQRSGFKNVTLLLGKTHYFSGNFAAARKYFAESSAPEARLWLAKSLSHESDKRKDALEMLAEITAEDPGELEAWYWMGRVQEQTGQQEQALRSFERAALEGSKLALVHLELSRLYASRGQTEKSREHKALATMLSPAVANGQSKK